MNRHPLTRLRRDPPACQTLLHFNNTAAALTQTPIFSVQNGCPDAGRGIGGHEPEAAHTPQPDRFHTGLAALHLSEGSIAAI
ncbi:MAG: hypothetical protein INF50_02685 [Rhodobacter sp.]|nr:hypothetical protein [Rhodobacter sp.]